MMIYLILSLRTDKNKFSKWSNKTRKNIYKLIIDQLMIFNCNFQDLMLLNSSKFFKVDKIFNLKINIIKVLFIISKLKFIKMKIWIFDNGNPTYWTIWIHVIIDNISGNIKSNTPYIFTRVIRANVPLPSSNIPFMPKFVDSKETQELYFISKNKYVVFGIVNNSKAPMTDCFYLRTKKIIERIDEGKL